MAYIDNTNEEERARALAAAAPGAPGASGSPAGGGANVPAAAPATTAASGTGFIPLQTYFGAQPLQDQSALTEQVTAAVAPVTPNWEVVQYPVASASPPSPIGSLPSATLTESREPGVYDRADYGSVQERATKAHDALNRAQSGTDYTEHIGENGYTAGMGAFDTALAQRSGGNTWAELEKQFGSQLDAMSSGDIARAGGRPGDPPVPPTPATEPLYTVPHDVESGWDAVKDTVTDTVKDVGNTGYDAVKDVFSPVVDAVPEPVKDVVRTGRDAVAGVVRPAARTARRVARTGAGAVRGVARGAENVVRSVGRAIDPTSWF
jgi:hypothetical protein